MSRRPEPLPEMLYVLLDGLQEHVAILEAAVQRLNGVLGTHQVEIGALQSRVQSLKLPAATPLRRSRAHPWRPRCPSTLPTVSSRATKLPPPSRTP